VPLQIFPPKILLHKIVAVTTGLPLENAAKNNFSLREWKYYIVISENYTSFSKFV
jgi:hypothetical protein